MLVYYWDKSEQATPHYTEFSKWFSVRTVRLNSYYKIKKR